MKQLEIQFFWPLTEQISLDLDYTPCEEYAKKRQEELFKSSVSITAGQALWAFNGGTVSNVNVVPTLQFKPEPNSVGYWEINKDLHVWRKNRPNWLHQKMTKVFFGWEWKDK